MFKFGLFLSLFTLAVLGHTGELDTSLEEKLDAELLSYEQGIKSFRGQELIDFSNIVTGSGRNDERLYVVIIEKLEPLIVEHKNNKKNDELAHEVNALSRTAAAVSPESHEMLADLVENSPSRGVRNRAHRLIPKLNWFEKRNKIMMNASSYQGGDDLMAYRFYNLIDSEEPRMTRWAAEEMNRRQGSQAFVYDRMRAYISSSYQNDLDKIGLDAVAWNCKILGAYDQKASKALLDQIAEDKKTHKKLRKYCKLKS